MSCLCGDTHCSSCGPAQGNWKCPICGQWADDCCEHIDDEGNLKPEFQAEADEKYRLEAEADEAFSRDLERTELMVECANLRDQLECIRRNEPRHMLETDGSKVTRLNDRIDQIERELGITSSR